MICSVFSNKDFEPKDVPSIFKEVDELCTACEISTVYLPGGTKIAEALFFRLLEHGYDVKLVNFKKDDTTIFSRYEILAPEIVPESVSEAILLRARFMTRASDFVIIHSDKASLFLSHIITEGEEYPFAVSIK